MFSSGKIVNYISVIFIAMFLVSFNSTKSHSGTLGGLLVVGGILDAADSINESSKGEKIDPLVFIADYGFNSVEELKSFFDSFDRSFESSDDPLDFDDPEKYDRLKNLDQAIKAIEDKSALVDYFQYEPGPQERAVYYLSSISRYASSFLKAREK